MNFTPRPINQHQRARLIAWTLSMLLWTLQALFAAALSPRHERQRRERMSLDWLTRQVKLLINSRANVLARLRIRRHLRVSYRGCRDVLEPGIINALIGVRLRPVLKRKGLIERITALIHALHHIDVYAAQVAKRLRRGLTRRCLHLFASLVARRPVALLTVATLLLTVGPARPVFAAGPAATPTTTATAPATAPATTPPADGGAAALSGQAIERFKAKDYDAAARLFEQAYAIDPNPNYLFNIGRVFEEKGDIRSVVDYYQRFVKEPGVDIGSRELAVQRLRVLKAILNETEAPAATPSGPQQSSTTAPAADPGAGPVDNPDPKKCSAPSSSPRPPPYAASMTGCEPRAAPSSSPDSSSTRSSFPRRTSPAIPATRPPSGSPSPTPPAQSC